MIVPRDLAPMIDRALTALGSAGDGLHSMRLLQRTPHKSTLLAERAGQRFVLRVDLPGATVPGLSRRDELAVLDWAAAADLGPTVAASAPGVLLLHYLDGRSWTADDLRDPRRLARAGRLLRRLHESSAGLVFPAGSATVAPSATVEAASAANLPPLPQPEERSSRLKPLPQPRGRSPAPGVSLPQLTRAYADQINTAEARATAARVLDLLPEPGPGEAALCHRDPTAPNLLETPTGELKLLDWEYAGPGDPLYDLAVIIEHHALDDAAADTLLKAWAAGARSGLRLQPACGRLSQVRGRLSQVREAYRLVAQLWQAAAEP